MKYAGKNANILKEGSFFKIAGDVKKAVYLKIKASKSGLIQVHDKISVNSRPKNLRQFDVCLCNARKKEISRKVGKGERDIDDSVVFGIQKGEIYYLKITNIDEFGGEIMYKYYEDTDDIEFDSNIYAKNKEHAVSLSGTYRYGLIGLRGAEEHWYVSEDDEVPRVLHARMWDLAGKQKDAEINIYDSQGNKIESIKIGENEKSRNYEVVGHVGNKIYIEVKVKEGSQVQYELALDDTWHG